MIRYFNVTRQIDIDNPNPFEWNSGANFYNTMRQAPLGPPSVFSFYLPDFHQMDLLQIRTS